MTTENNEQNGGNNSSNAENNNQQQNQTEATNLPKSQDELDRLLKRRLDQERRQWQTTLEDERKKAAMTAEEKLKAEKDAADKKAADATSAADRRAIRSEAKVQALGLGVKAERIDYTLKLADLSAVAVDSDGEPDAKAVKAAIEAVLKDLPELKGSATAGKSGGEFNGNGGGEVNPWDPATFNLTKQGEIMKTNPEKAAQMMAAAKKK